MQISCHADTDTSEICDENDFLHSALMEDITSLNSQTPQRNEHYKMLHKKYDTQGGKALSLFS